MASLASFHRALSPIVGLSEAALYERQKALVKVGVLPRATGRGWASGGASATPVNVAWMLVSLLATDSLSEVPGETLELSNLLITPGDQRLIPAGASFVGAVAHVLSDPALAEQTIDIYAARKTRVAGIRWLTMKAPKAAYGEASFIGDAASDCGFLVRASLNNDAIGPIARLLSERD